jgi:hypothetical protein
VDGVVVVAAPVGFAVLVNTVGTGVDNDGSMENLLLAPSLVGDDVALVTVGGSDGADVLAIKGGGTRLGMGEGTAKGCIVCDDDGLANGINVERLLGMFDGATTGGSVVGEKFGGLGGMPGETLEGLSLGSDMEGADVA